MGNQGSCEGPYADIELTPQAQPLVVLDQRFVRSDVARLRLKLTSDYSKNLSFKDVMSNKVLFHTGPNRQLGLFLDESKQPLAKVCTKKDINNIYYVYRPDADEEKEDTQLFQVYIKQGAATRNSYLDTNLRVDFTDATTGERCKIEIQGEWRSRSAMLWLQRSGAQQPRMPFGKIYRPPKAKRDGFNLDIAPNVDTAFALLVCAIIDDDLKRLRRYENGQAFFA